MSRHGRLLCGNRTNERARTFLCRTPNHTGQPIVQSSQKCSRTLAALLLGLACLAVPAHADDYAMGLAALEAGNAALAIELWRPLAESGDVESQFGLGVMYNDGLGVERDYIEANYWFLRAAEQGHAPSQFNLGNAYKNGTGTAPAPGMAVHWWRKAAEQGFGPAQFNLGSALLEGNGIQRDRVAALRWYRRAAANGHPQAQTFLGQIAEALPRRARESGGAGAVPQTATGAENAGDTVKPQHADARAKAQSSAPTTTDAAAPLPTTVAAAQPAPSGCAAWLDRDALPFTVQLLSSRAAGDVSAYAQQHALSETATCSYVVKGRRWHALLFGRFPSAAAALAALPAAVRADGAYVRRIAEIRTAVAQSTQP